MAFRPTNMSSRAANRMYVVLARFKNRHDRILRIIASWLSNKLGSMTKLFVDLDNTTFQPLSDIFDSLRPNIAIGSGSSIITLELTICHETNIVTSREYKINKYKNLSNRMLPSVSNYSLDNFTIEVTPLDFISDMSDFFNRLGLKNWSREITKSLRQSVISESYKIYCLRNSAAQ